MSIGCERYGLSVAGLTGVIFCTKSGARVAGELVADLRAEIVTLRNMRLAEISVSDLRAREIVRLEKVIRDLDGSSCGVES